MLRKKRRGGDPRDESLSGVFTGDFGGITDALSKVRIGKGAVSRMASRLEEEQQRASWRERPLKKNYSYLYLDATFLRRSAEALASRTWPS